MSRNNFTAEILRFVVMVSALVYLNMVEVVESSYLDQKVSEF